MLDGKGIVGVRSKDDELINRFSSFLLKHFPKEKLRTRKVFGYVLTKEIYVCSYPLRKFFESTIKARITVLVDKQYAAPFFAGLLDGDGSIDVNSRMVYLAYGLRDKEEVEIDKKLLQYFGFDASINKSGKALKLNIHKPKNFLIFILPYVTLSRKRAKISEYLG